MFDFGENWRRYSRDVLDAARGDAARASLEELLGPGALAGKRFLDVGFGSGVFAIGAVQLGAAHVVGIDVNETCVSAARANADRFLTGPAKPEFLQHSILDLDAVASLGTFDVVYAWGSLHHTGALWDALRNTASLVAPGGRLVVALYNRHWSSPGWTTVKRMYNLSPRPLKWLMYGALVPLMAGAKLAVTRKNPFRKRRGMAFSIDVIDWLGGYPYEYATADEVIAFASDLGFELVSQRPPDVPTGCNEFVFRR